VIEAKLNGQPTDPIDPLGMLGDDPLDIKSTIKKLAATVRSITAFDAAIAAMMADAKMFAINRHRELRDDYQGRIDYAAAILGRMECVAKITLAKRSEETLVAFDAWCADAIAGARHRHKKSDLATAVFVLLFLSGDAASMATHMLDSATDDMIREDADDHHADCMGDIEPEPDDDETD